MWAGCNLGTFFFICSLYEKQQLIFTIATWTCSAVGWVKKACWMTRLDSFTQPVNISFSYVVVLVWNHIIYSLFRALTGEGWSYIYRHTRMLGIAVTGLGQHTQSSDLNLSERLREWTRPEAVRVVTVLLPFSLSLLSSPPHSFHLSNLSSTSEGLLHLLFISSHSDVSSSHMRHLVDAFIPSSLQYHGCVHF